jgi:hypothetical protein
MRFREIVPDIIYLKMIKDQNDPDGPFMGHLREGWTVAVNRNGGTVDIVAYEGRRALKEGRSCLTLDGYDAANLRLLVAGKYARQERE